eukprot:12934654-Prorocentrum_lima.AAC.1
MADRRESSIPVKRTLTKMGRWSPANPQGGKTKMASSLQRERRSEPPAQVMSPVLQELEFLQFLEKKIW